MQKHKVLAFLLALIVSVGLWFYAVTVVNPDDTVSIRGIRVRIIGAGTLESNNLILTGGEDQTVDVSISGRRSDLKELNSSSLEAIADVSNIDRAGVYEVSWTLDPPSTVASGDISVTSANSNKITVKVSEYNERPEIPVSVEYQGDLPEGYVRDPAVLNTETISFKGPEEEVSRIAKAVVTINLSGATQSLTADLDYRLLDEKDEELTVSKYVTASVPTVRVSVPISCYKQIKLGVKLIPGGGATEKNVKLSIEPSTIGVSGTAEALKKLDELTIREIDLSQISGTQSWTVVPDLPAGVTNRASENSVVITLKITGLMTKKFTIPCTEIERLNDNNALEFGEQSVTVTLRGTASAISAINAEDIHISADMKKDYDAATKTVALKITLPENTTVGVIEEPYTVQIIEASG